MNTGEPAIGSFEDRLDLLRPSLDPAYADLPADELAALLRSDLVGLEAEELEALLSALEISWGKAIGNALGSAGSKALGAGLGALATGLGSALGGVLGGRRRPRARRRPRRPAVVGPRRRVLIPRRPLVGPRRPIVVSPSTPVAGPPGSGSPTSPPPTVSDPQNAARALLAALQDPKVLQSLAALVLGAIGRKDLELPASDVVVSHRAVLHALRELTDLALDEAPGSDAEPTAYLKDAEGQFTVDPHDASARAERLVGLLRDEQAALAEELHGPDARWAVGEALIQPLSTHLSNRARFRAGVPMTTIFPFSAVCQLRMQMSGTGSSWFHGTGFYIGPNRILTAGHNIFGEDGFATRMIVTPGRNGSERPFGSFEVQPAAMVAHPSWRRRPKSAAFDLAVLKVRTGPPNGEFFELEELRFTPKSGIAVCGYAADRAAGVDPDQQNLDYDTIRDLDAESFTYSLNTTGGTSGSPVFYVTHGAIRAVGVHSRTHDRHTNRGCRLTDAKVAWIRAVSDEGLPQDLEPWTQEDPRDVTPTGRGEGGLEAPSDEWIVEGSDEESWGLEDLVEAPRLGPHGDDEAAGLEELTQMGAFEALEPWDDKDRRWFDVD